MLVNTRCEISLARIINVPDRELDHKAFTNIKHVASQKNMPMYQVDENDKANLLRNIHYRIG